MIEQLDGVLRVELLGPFRICRDGRDIAIAYTPARLVLVQLALAPGHAMRRERLAGLLWERSDQAAALRNLRQALYHLRLALGADWPGLHSDRNTVRLNPKLIETDLGLCLARIAAGDVPDEALQVPALHDRFLADLPDQGELHQSWIRLKRAEFEGALRRSLETLANAAAPKTARLAAEALLTLDPANELAARRLMGLAAQAGDIGQALGVYAALWDHLDDVYAMEPSPETQALVAAIKTGDPTPQPQPERQVTDSGRQLRVGLEPVAHAGSAREEMALVGLFRAELLARLARFREICSLDLGALAPERQDQPVDFRLRVYATTREGRLVIVAVLVNGADGTVIWTDRSEAVAARWWEHQARLAGRLASALSLSISRARLTEITRLARTRGAVDNWLMGQSLIARFDADAAAKAIVHFRAAIALDPDYSPAFSSLSGQINIRHLSFPGTRLDAQTLSESRDLANRAVALDPLDARAHLARGWAHCLLRDFAQAETCFAMARHCNENDAWVVMSTALGAGFVGDAELATGLAQRALDEGWTTRPVDWGYHATIRFLVGDDEGCVDAAVHATGGISNVPGWAAAALWRLGREDDACAAWAGFVADMRRRWVGTRPASDAAVLDWFLNCFPIRDPATYGRLAKAINSVVATGR